MLGKLQEIIDTTFPHLKSGFVMIKVEDRNWLFQTIKEQQKEIIEHCNTKGHLGKQVIALTNLVIELSRQIKQAKEEIRELKSRNRYRNFIEIATENLRLAEENKRLTDGNLKGCCHEGQCKGANH